MDRRRTLVFWMILLVGLGACLALFATLAWSRLADRVLPSAVEAVLERLPEARRHDLYRSLLRDTDLFGPEMIEYSMQQMSQEAKDALYDRMAARVDASWDALPEPDVGRVHKRHHSFTLRGAGVATNNVGFRSRRPFVKKEAGRYRIVCLGDSMVFGSGGAEEDRFCDQIEDFYASAGVTVGGQPIETYAVGVGSWSMVNEAAYINSRITAYDPDLVIALTVDNDITDSMGVTGAGVASRQFSPEYRDRGTAVFLMFPPGFGRGGATALRTDLAPEARKRWAKGMGLLKRLEDLQQQRGKHTLFSILDRDRYFTAVYKDYYRRLGFRSPMLVTTYRWPGEDTALPHDSHPNRLGHAIMAGHYIHALAHEGIIPVAAEELPELHAGLSVEGSPPGNPGELTQIRSSYVDRFLETELAFDNLGSNVLKSYLGGYFPEKRKHARGQYPFSSVKSGFLLKRLPVDGGTFELEIIVPRFPELYPFELRVWLQGHPVETLRLERPEQGGRHTIVADLPPLEASDLAVEVMLETSCYWTSIDDNRMKSFYLVSARLHDGARPGDRSGSPYR